jgi:tryptophan-rich sensory protein
MRSPPLRYVRSDPLVAVPSVRARRWDADAPGVAGWLAALAFVAFVNLAFPPALGRAGYALSDSAGPALWLLPCALLAAAGWLGWHDRRAPFRARKAVLRASSVEIVLAGLWVPLLFAWDAPLLALIALWLLGMTLLASVPDVRRTRPVALWLVAPSLAWVAFALTFHLGLWTSA